LNSVNQLVEDPKQLCLDLLRAESEDEVTKILQKYSLLDDSLWRDLGDDENNFSIVGNQQSTSSAALVEKIINSIDAILMAKCLIAGIDPESATAPKNMREASEKFLGVKYGSLLSLSPTERSGLAEKSIWMVATGFFDKPCYTFIDFGEGQTPKKMPETFLSLFRKSKKIRIPFVQGRFLMGGTGVLPYCGQRRYQLVISRRHPEIARSEVENETRNLWGFTILRRVPREGVRSSIYRYLAPDGNVLSFNSETLPLRPGGKNDSEAFIEPVEWGTCIKLYNYQFDVAAFKTNLKLDLSRELDRHLVSMPLPVRLCECRAYPQASPKATLSGIEVRLHENKAEVLEDKFPSSALLTVPDLGDIPIEIYLFKRNAGKRFISKKSAILFIVNGQTHGAMSSGFFLRPEVQLEYVKDDLLIIADCTEIPGMGRDDLFMNSRDRLRDGPIRNIVEEQLEMLLHNHRGLQDMNKQRELEATQNILKDNKLLEKLIDRMLSFTPSLAAFFSSGDRLTSPHLNGGQNPNYEGKKFPTYFRVVDEPEGGLTKECPTNAKCGVVFETDVENQYFTRKSDPGQLTLIPAGVKVGLLLWNGRGVLFLKNLPDAEPNTLTEVVVEVSDTEHISPLTSKFKLKALKPIPKIKRPEPKKRRKKKKSRQLALPNIIRVQKERWSEFEFDECSGIALRGSNIFVNVDNVYLVTEKSRSKSHPQILEEQFTNGLVLASLAIRHDFNERKRRGQTTLEEDDIRERIEESSRGLAAVILPIIQQLETLKIKRSSLIDVEES
jgi:hypothetical protein